MSNVGGRHRKGPHSRSPFFPSTPTPLHHTPTPFTHKTMDGATTAAARQRVLLGHLQQRGQVRWRWGEGGGEPDSAGGVTQRFSRSVSGRAMASLRAPAGPARRPGVERGLVQRPRG